MHRYAVLILTLVATTACARNVHRPYQTIPLTRGLEHDGFLVGIETRKRLDVKVGFEGPDPKRLREPTFTSTDAQALDRSRVFRRVMSDDDILFVSHCYEMRSLGCGTTLSRTLYNGYDPGGETGEPDGVFDDADLDYEEGYAALDRLAGPLELMARTKRATHLLLLSMGWHNDQIECLGRYNAMLRELRKVASQEGCADFEPIVVGLTWPSAWLQGSPLVPVETVGHLGSYFSKANDADEIGFGIANHLLHEVILPLKEKQGLSDLRVVLIGHSMGARALSRALFSRTYLRSACEGLAGERADLFLGLQPAMDAYRFVPGEGKEGSPYADCFSPGTPVVMTTSDYDKANPAARWITGARHIGGHYGKQVVRQHPRVYRLVEWDPTTGPDPALAWGVPGNVTVVDATSIVRGAETGVHKRKVDGHNDVLDHEMAELIWHYIGALRERKPVSAP